MVWVPYVLRVWEDWVVVVVVVLGVGVVDWSEVRRVYLRGGMLGGRVGRPSWVE